MPANDIMCGIVKALQSCRRELHYEVESELKIALRKSNVFLEMEVKLVIAVSSNVEFSSLPLRCK